MRQKKDDIFKITKQILKNAGYTQNTIKIYYHYISEFLEKVNKNYQRYNAEDFETYLLNYPYSSISQQNQIINALRFLYAKVLKKRYAKVSFERPRKEKRLPKPISADFLRQKIDQIKNLKHKAILSLAFSDGLRVSEVINLKLTDIDSKRMMIRIEQGKGKKDRDVPLSENVLSLLRQYCRKFRPKEYLFNGQNKPKYSAVSCNKIMKKYIGEQYHFHQLRHSTFTALTESNIDLRAIQKLAGHASSKTTEIYTLVSNQRLSEIPLPL